MFSLQISTIYLNGTKGRPKTKDPHNLRLSRNVPNLLFLDGKLCHILYIKCSKMKYKWNNNSNNNNSNNNISNSNRLPKKTMQKIGLQPATKHIEFFSPFSIVSLHHK